MSGSGHGVRLELLVTSAVPADAVAWGLEPRPAAPFEAALERVVRLPFVPAAGLAVGLYALCPPGFADLAEFAVRRVAWSEPYEEFRAELEPLRRYGRAREAAAWLCGWGGWRPAMEPADGLDEPAVAELAARGLSVVVAFGARVVATPDQVWCLEQAGEPFRVVAGPASVDPAPAATVGSRA